MMASSDDVAVLQCVPHILSERLEMIHDVSSLPNHGRGDGTYIDMASFKDLLLHGDFASNR